MRKVIAGLLLLYSFSYGITLEKLISEALRSSPVLKQKRLDVKIQEAVKKDVKSRRFGEAKIILNGTKYEDTRILYPLTPPIDPRRLVGAEHQLIAGISYSLPLFTGFELKKNTEIASIGKEIKLIDYKLTKNQLIFNIKSTYLKVLELEKSLSSLKAYRASLEKLYNDVQLAVELGKKPETDLLKVKYQLEQAKAEIKKAKNSINSLKQLIRYLVGNEDLELSKLEDVKATGAIDISGLEEKINSLDIVKKATLSHEIARKKVEIAVGRYLPRVFFNASAQRNMGNGEYRDLWQVGFTVEFTLLDFGKRKSQYIQSKLELEKTRLFKKDLRMKIKKELVDAVNKINSATSEIKAAEKQIVYAKKVEETEKAKYEEGVTDMFNLLYAKAQRIQAETNYFRAVYEKERAVSYLYYLLEEFKDE